MEFVRESALENVTYETYPFPHTVIDNFFKTDKLEELLTNINSLKDEDAETKFINPYSQYEFNKLAYNTNYGDHLKKIFAELNSSEFIAKLENITGIKDIIRNDTTLIGAGIHRIKNGGFLQLHTDFNSYHNHYGKLDRRINLIIYMNPDWKEEYNGSLCLCDKESNTCVKKILPILNRCVIFNTSNKSIHGHPEILKTPDDICRQSIAVYYYTKNNNNEVDFEGDREHTTIWYPNIQV
jgi:Rps23 Pro-64 3,4-dihydroxylase Tpa1-like proline 4-hydroxylase